MLIMVLLTETRLPVPGIWYYCYNGVSLSINVKWTVTALLWIQIYAVIDNFYPFSPSFISLFCFRVFTWHLLEWHPYFIIIGKESLGVYSGHEIQQTIGQICHHRFLSIKIILSDSICTHSLYGTNLLILSGYKLYNTHPPQTSWPSYFWQLRCDMTFFIILGSL